MVDRAWVIVRTVCVFAGMCLALALCGCARKLYDPAWATPPYPAQLHTTQTADMQVFRSGTNLEIVNSTARSYAEFDLWINQRYVCHLDSLRAGETRRLSLWEFHDEYGDVFNAGGFFRNVEPTPVRLVEIQSGLDQPMIGLITIRSEEVMVKPQPGEG